MTPGVPQFVLDAGGAEHNARVHVPTTFDGDSLRARSFSPDMPFVDKRLWTQPRNRPNVSNQPTTVSHRRRLPSSSLSHHD